MPGRDHARDAWSSKSTAWRQEVAAMSLTVQPTALAHGPRSTIKRVFVGVDDSGSGLAALAEATKLARSSDAELVAVRAWALGLPRHGGRRMRHLAHPHIVLSFSGAEQCEAATVLAQRAFGRAVGRMPTDLPVTIATPQSDPALALVDLASQPGDVIVVGRRSGHPVRRLIHGSVSRYCDRHARCPVIVVSADAQPSATASDRARGRRRTWSR